MGRENGLGGGTYQDLTEKEDKESGENPTIVV